MYTHFYSRSDWFKELLVFTWDTPIISCMMTYHGLNLLLFLAFSVFHDSFINS